MGRKRNRTRVEKIDFAKSLSSLSLEEMDALNKSLPNLMQSKIQAAMNSDNMEEIMKANLFFSAKNQKQEFRSILFNPYDSSDSGRDYKRTKGILSLRALRQIGNTFIVKSIVNTRVEQIQNFLHFSEDEQKPGFTIKRKAGLFSTGEKKDLNDSDKKEIEKIVEFLERGGDSDKWDTFDTFQDFVRKISFDSLTLDQLAFECVRNRGFELSKFRAIDASLIHFLDSVDPKQKESFEKYRFKGQLPRYCMVWEGQILKNPASHESVIYYPWELGFGIRNKSTDIERNGYGTSEIETLLEIITWVLMGMQTNGNFFTQGSQPKGFINVKNANITPEGLAEFRQSWSQSMKGYQNSHKTPIIQGVDLEWIDLQMSNRDMEFNEWIKFLIILICSVYRIDPSELGFQFKEQAQIFGQDGQRERLSHSKEKGLKPLLTFLSNIINKYLISELNEEFEFSFTGVDPEDEAEQVELDKKKSEAGFVDMKDMFKKYSGRDFDPENDIILNSVYQSAKQATDQMAMMGGQGMNDLVDQGEDEDTNPFDKYGEEIEKSRRENPILDSALKYIDKTWM